MKECRHCLELKELDAFQKDAAHPDGYKAVCKPCRAKRTRELSSMRRIGRAPHSIEEQRAMTAIHKAYRKFDGTAEVVIPVKALNHPHPAKRACVIRPMEDKNRILISTLTGVREYEFELVSPQALLKILSELDYQVYLP